MQILLNFKEYFLEFIVPLAQNKNNNPPGQNLKKKKKKKKKEQRK